MLRRFSKRQRSLNDPEKFRLTDLILIAAAVGNALAILILFTYFWFACDWPVEHPSPVVYQLGETMVTVVDASLPDGGGGNIHWEHDQTYLLFTPEFTRKHNVRQFEGSAHRPVMIMCTRDSCSECDRMEKETLSNQSISDRLNEKWVCIQVNPDSRNEHVPFSAGWGLMSYRAFAVYFRVDKLPAFIFIDKEGNPIQRVSGYWSADKFGHLLDYIQREVYKRNITIDEYRRSLLSSYR